MSTPSSIPAGFNTLTPYLVVDDADAAIALYEKAFGAKAVSVHRLPDGKVMNAQLRIGDSMLMLNGEFPDYGVIGPNKIGNSAVTMHLYVDDVDSLWKQATDAGFEVKMPLDNQQWGDRYGSLKDPFGHFWSMATHKEDVSAEEIAKRITSM